jgi:transposase
MQKTCAVTLPVLVSDCLAIYDDATALQQKCYAHHHKAIRQAKALHPQQGEGFLNEVTTMLRAAVALQAQKAECDPESFQTLRQTLERTVSRYYAAQASRSRIARERGTAARERGALQ